MNDKTTPSPLPEIRSTMFALILSLCKRLIKLNFTSFYHRSTLCALDLSSIDCTSSTLTELEIYVKTFDDCLYLLDERLNCLSTLEIHVEEIVYTPETIDTTVSIIVHYCVRKKTVNSIQTYFVSFFFIEKTSQTETFHIIFISTYTCLS